VTFGNLGFEILADAPKGPLILARLDEKSGGAGRIHFLFHPDRSTLPYRVAFPILMSNLVSLAQRMAGLSEASALSTGVLPPQPSPPGAKSM
jgi:hypothetical protein